MASLVQFNFDVVFNSIELGPAERKHFIEKNWKIESKLFAALGIGHFSFMESCMDSIWSANKLNGAHRRRKEKKIFAFVFCCSISLFLSHTHSLSSPYCSVFLSLSCSLSDSLWLHQPIESCSKENRSRTFRAISNASWSHHPHSTGYRP